MYVAPMASELVRFNEATKTFEVASHAVKALRALDGPICVVSICGRARHGKSFLLNQLLSRLQPSGVSGRFSVGSTVKPCTKGLWLWSQPLPRTTPDGQRFHLLLVDAEGIDSYDQTADYSNHIFSLALLLSSVLVYNQMGSIDESSVDKLASVCEFARLICGRADTAAAAAGAGNSSSGLRGSLDELQRDVSPAFIWLLRDFQLQLDEDGRQISLQEYMEGVLREAPGASEAIRAKNQLRASIKARFPERDCHALVRPLHDEARLAKMDALPPSELRPEFRRGLDVLVDLVLSRCRPKTIRGSRLTGPALAGLAEAYCRVINSGGVPAIASTWQSVVQSECRRALDAATDLYRDRMETARGGQVGLEALDSFHEAALKAAAEEFSSRAVGEAADQEPFLRRLREAAAALVAPLRQTKRAEAEARVVERLTGAARRFTTAVRGEDSDLEAAETQLHEFLREYGKEQGLGPDKFIRAAEFLAGTVVPELRRLAQEARARAAAASQQVSELQAKVAQLSRGSEDLRGSLGAATLAEGRLQRELTAAKAAEAGASAVAAVARAEAEAARTEAAALREQLAAARVEFAGRAEVEELGTTRARSELAAAQSRPMAAEAAAQAAASARVAVQQQLAAREAEIAARAAEAREACRVAEAAQAAEAQERRHAEALAAQLASRDATLANLQRERDFLQASLDQQAHHPVGLSAAAAAPTCAGADTSAAAIPGGGRAAAAVAAAADGRPNKRNRPAAGTHVDVDVYMMDADPDDGGDDGVMEADAEVEVGDVVAAAMGPRGRRGGGNRAAAAGAGRAEAGSTSLQRPQRRQRTGTEPQQLPHDGAVAATPPPGVTAVAGGGAGGGERTPFSVEREVLRTTRRGTPAEAAAARAAAAAATPATPAGRATAAVVAAGAAAGAAMQGDGTGGGRSPFSVEREVLRTTRRGTPAEAAATQAPAAAATATTPGGRAAATAAATVGAGGPAAQGGGDGDGGGERSPFRVERVVLRTTPRSTGGAGRDRGAGPAAAATVTATATTEAADAAPHDPLPGLPAELDKMKVDELKHWLTTHGYEQEVFQKSRGRLSKKDWADLVRSKCGQSGRT